MDNQMYVLLSDIRNLLRENLEVQKKILSHHQWEAKMIQENMGTLGVPSQAVHECPSTCDDCSC